MLAFQDGDGNTVLHFAAKNGFADIVEYLVKKAKEQDENCPREIVEQINAKGFTPMIEVCLRGY